MQPIIERKWEVHIVSNTERAVVGREKNAGGASAAKVPTVGGVKE